MRKYKNKYHVSGWIVQNGWRYVTKYDGNIFIKALFIFIKMSLFDEYLFVRFEKRDT